MSSATIEFPSTSTQLYFSFGDETADTTTDRVADSKLVGASAGRSKPRTSRSINTACDRGTPFPKGPITPHVAKNSSIPTAPVYQDAVMPVAGGNEPVRIGALLLRLLKQYGITDEEIAEGIEAYEAKRAASKPQLVSISA